MSASLTEIQTWFKRGVENGAKYMVIVTDTFDYENYPRFFVNDEDCLQAINNPGNMQRVEEVYDLEAVSGPQFAASRVWNAPLQTASKGV